MILSDLPIEELKTIAWGIQNDASSIRNPDRKDWLVDFINENKHLINSSSVWYNDVLND